MVRVDTGDGNPFDVKEAAMLPLRCALITVPGERFGLLLCERRGTATLKQDYAHAVLNEVGRLANVTISLEQHVDTAEWHRFLEGADIASVRAVYYSTRREDFQPSLSKPSKLSVALEGAPAQRAGTSLVRQMLASLTSHTSRPDAQLIAELRPNTDGFDRERVEIRAAHDGLTRTLVFEESGYPQWVYELAHHLGDKELLQVWEEHGPQLIARYLSDPPR